MDETKFIICSLSTLQFNIKDFEEKEKMVLNESLLRRINKSAGDQILYFLFNKIDTQHASKVFRDCWPKHDVKAETNFRNASYEWFKQLNQDSKFNLKPTIVFTKATVTPSSNKFLKTLAILCRMALQSDVIHKAPNYNLLALPTLAKNPEERIAAMKIIKSFKLDHIEEYSLIMRGHLQNLETTSKLSKRFVLKYRKLVEENQLNENQIAKEIRTDDTSTCKCPSSCSSHEHCLQQSICNKNEEIQQLWTAFENYKKADDETWPIITSVVNRNSGQSKIDGLDYKKYLSEQEQQFYVDEKLDLLALLNKSASSLLDLREKCSNISPQQGIEQEIIRLTSRVKSLAVGINEVLCEVRESNPNLLESINNKRSKMEHYQHIFTNDIDDFDLCPPTPPVNLTNEDTSRLQTPFKIFKLSPSGIPSTPKRDAYECSSPNLNQLLLKKNHRIRLDYGSPLTLNFHSSKSVTNLNSPKKEVTHDSGCISGGISYHTFNETKTSKLPQDNSFSSCINEPRVQSSPSWFSPRGNSEYTPKDDKKPPWVEVHSVTPGMPVHCSPVVEKLLLEIDSYQETDKHSYFESKRIAGLHNTCTYSASQPTNDDDFFASVHESASVLSTKDSTKTAVQNNKDYLTAFEFILDDLPDYNDDSSSVAANKTNGTLKIADSFLSSNLQEDFIDASDFLDNCSSKNTFLRESVFDTVTEALTAGELDSSLVLDKEIEKTVRRESSSVPRRQSSLNLGQGTIQTTRRLSEVYKLEMLLDEPNIFDESDSCLMSLSMEDL